MDVKFKENLREIFHAVKHPINDINDETVYHLLVQIDSNQFKLSIS